MQQLYRQAADLDEENYGNRKEPSMRFINKAIIDMHHKPFNPTMKHYKHLVTRSVLCSLFDEIARGEYNLRSSIGMAKDERFAKHASFRPKNTKEAESASSTTKQASKPPDSQTPSTVKAKKNQLVVQQPVDIPVQPVDWSEPKSKMYLQRLNILVRNLIIQHLGSLQILLEYDGYILNPMVLQRRKESITLKY